MPKMRVEVPKKWATKLQRASAAETTALEKADAARLRLALGLVEAQEAGYSVRALALALDRSPGQIHLLIQQGHDARNGGGE